MKYISYTPGGSSGLLQKAAGVAATVAVASVMFVFSSVLLALLLIAAVVGGIWLWWKMRHVRKMMHDMQAHVNQTREAFEAQGAFRQGPFAQQRPFSREENVEGVVIEGEAVRVDEPRERIPR